MSSLAQRKLQQCVPSTAMNWAWRNCLTSLSGVIIWRHHDQTIVVGLSSTASPPPSVVNGALFRSNMIDRLLQSAHGLE
jgi:hypothetical protein